MSEPAPLLEVRERLTCADHQTHRRYVFHIPPDCRRLRISFQYAPKFLPPGASARLIAQAQRLQAASLASRLGQRLAEQWAADMGAIPPDAQVPNLLTISLDDAMGAYRGAGHRHAAQQVLVIGVDTASAGLVAGLLPVGEWALTLTAHTLVSPYCDVAIQIGAETASNRS